MISRWRSLPPAAQDIAAGLAFVFVWFVLYEFWASGDWNPVRPHSYHVAGLWSAVAIAARRRAPVFLLLSTTVAYPLVYNAGFGTPLQTEFHLLPVFIAGYGAAASGRMRPLIAALLSTTAVTSITALAFGWSAAASGYPDRSLALFHLFATVGVVYLGAVVHRQRATTVTLAERNAELERLRTVEAAKAVAEERTRIARELHDVIAHHLVSLIVRGQAAMRLSPTRPEYTSETMMWMVETARDALSSVRKTLHVLRTEDEDPLMTPGPTLADLEAITRRVSDAGLEVLVEVDDRLPQLEGHVELAAVRIAQEALTNTLRHSDAGRAIVTLRHVRGGISLEIEDDGDGPSVHEIHGIKGHGLLGMRERAMACGGSLDIDSGPLGGWRVRAMLPASNERVGT